LPGRRRRGLGLLRRRFGLVVQGIRLVRVGQRIVHRRLQDEIRPKHIRELVEPLRERETIGPKTIRNVYGTLRTLFGDAVVDELVVATPCVLPTGALPSVPNEEKRISNAFRSTGASFYALAVPTACATARRRGRRWRPFDPAPQPLGCLEVPPSTAIGH
jgi:hypothetical protein